MRRMRHNLLRACEIGDIFSYRHCGTRAPLVLLSQERTFKWQWHVTPPLPGTRMELQSFPLSLPWLAPTHPSVRWRWGQGCSQHWPFPQGPGAQHLLWTLQLTFCPLMAPIQQDPLPQVHCSHGTWLEDDPWVPPQRDWVSPSFSVIIPGPCGSRWNWAVCLEHHDWQLPLSIMAAMGKVGFPWISPKWGLQPTCSCALASWTSSRSWNLPFACFLLLLVTGDHKPKFI